MPPGAKIEAKWPKHSALNKLCTCLAALGLAPKLLTLGGGQLCVIGLRADIQLAIEVRYNPGTTERGAFSATFAGAKVHDPIGVIRNLESSYKINPSDAKSMGMSASRARELEQQRNNDYNTGDQMRIKVAHLTSATEMNEWLDDWIDLLKAKTPYQARKPAPKPAEPDLFGDLDWDQGGA